MRNSAEDIILLGPIRHTEEVFTLDLQVPIPHRWERALRSHAHRLNKEAKDLGIELREKIAPEVIVRNLIYWYIKTGGWPQMVSGPPPEVNDNLRAKK
jgi:hypothetical protein